MSVLWLLKVQVHCNKEIKRKEKNTIGSKKILPKFRLKKLKTQPQLIYFFKAFTDSTKDKAKDVNLKTNLSNKPVAETVGLKSNCTTSALSLD